MKRKKVTISAELPGPERIFVTSKVELFQGRFKSFALIDGAEPVECCASIGHDKDRFPVQYVSPVQGESLDLQGRGKTVRAAVIDLCKTVKKMKSHASARHCLDDTERAFIKRVTVRVPEVESSLTSRWYRWTEKGGVKSGVEAARG